MTQISKIEHFQSVVRSFARVNLDGDDATNGNGSLNFLMPAGTQPGDLGLSGQHEGSMAMPYQLQPARTTTRDTQWLALLVSTFDKIARDPAKPNTSAVSGLKAQLMRPAGSAAASSQSQD